LHEIINCVAILEINCERLRFIVDRQKNYVWNQIFKFNVINSKLRKLNIESKFELIWAFRGVTMGALGGTSFFLQKNNWP